MSLVSEDGSPLFSHSKKVSFLDMQTIASSSFNNSPLQEVINTPIFRVRKLQQQLIKERDYSDGLKRELSIKLTLVAQRESQINRLQNCLDKMKEEEVVREQVARNQMDELEDKNNTLQSRLNNILKHNKELSNDFALLEHKMDEVAEENGELSSRMRTVCSQLANSKAEIVRLTETQTAAEAQWRSNTNLLQTELNQARAQIELLIEQSEILQGKISCLEDEISRSTKQEEGENMWLAIEREMLESQISLIKNKLESTEDSLQKREEGLLELKKETSIDTELLKTENHKQTELLQSLNDQVQSLSDSLKRTTEQLQVKEELLAQKEREISHEKDAFKNLSTASDEEIRDLKMKIQAKEEQMVTLQNEASSQSDLHQQDIHQLKKQLDGMVDTFSKAEDKVQTQMLMFTEQNQRSVQEQGLLRQKLSDSEAVIGKLENEINAKEQQITLLKHRNLEDSSVLHQQIESLQKQLELLVCSLKEAEDDMRSKEMVKKDFLEQLSIKSLAAEHYKAQMEKAVSHYNSKKQLLQESEEVVANLKHSLEVKEREVKTATTENKLLQMELDKFQTNEKTLVNKMASLEAQLAFADKALRAQNKIPYNESASEHTHLDVPFEHSCVKRVKFRRLSSDQSSLEDSLNNTRKLSAPGESSTPLVRSSERLAAKRHGLKAESLETLYFTPVNTRHRNTTDYNQEVTSVRKDPASSVKRHRTTQKTPGCSEADETYYSTHTAQPVSTELFKTPARVPGTEADQLIGLPGYRRSTLHSQTASTFCVGAENEPEGGPEDWIRIAEIQTRNKSCLLHLKSSYPVEFYNVHNSALIVTDEELRTGDPSETIRRASMMPSQLQDSLASHRHSFIMGQSGAAPTGCSSLSMMPGPVSSTLLRSPKGTKRASSTLTLHQTSPQKKIKASCFSHPLTPEKNNLSSGPAYSNIHATLSPVDRRESRMFTIDNTPKKENYLKKGLNKLRSSTRKSPGKALKKSPAQAGSRRGQENVPAGNNRTATGASGRLRSQRSPLVT